MTSDHRLPHVASAYRDERAAAAQRLAELWRARPLERRTLQYGLRRVYAARRARVVMGITAALGFGMLAAVTLFLGLTRNLGHGIPVAILGAAVFATAIAFEVGRHRGLSGFDAALDRAEEELRQGIATALPDVAVARLEAESVAEVALRVVRAEEARSIGWALTAVTLLGPLTLHFLLSVFFLRAVGDFDAWIALSLGLVGHAHVAASVVAFRHGRVVAATSTAALQPGGRGGWRAVGTGAAVAAAPGALALLIPPILAAVTGAVLLPVSYGLVRRVILDERNALEP